MHHEIMSEITGELGRNARFKAITNSKGTSLAVTTGSTFERRWVPGRSAQSVRNNGKDTQEARSANPGTLFIEENNIRQGVHTFAGREVRFGREFTRKRANQAFKDYIALRNAAQDRMGMKHGGEIGLRCTSFEDASRRVLELVGPVPMDVREYGYLRLGPWETMRAMGNGTPVKGFTANIFGLRPNGLQSLIQVHWRLEFDPKKRLHFNTIIRPASAPESISLCEKGDPSSLNIAFCFPIKRDIEYRNIIEEHIIGDFDSGNSQTGYLPRHI